MNDEPTGPFEHVDEQERAWSGLNTHGPGLAESAAAFRVQRPGAELVGFIAEFGTD